MDDFAELLQKYAELTVNVGAGIKEGDTVYLQVATDQTEFAHLLVTESYKSGAREVLVNWTDDFLTKQTLLHAADEVLTTFKDSKKAEIEYLLSQKAKRINVKSEDPDALHNVDPKKLGTYQATNAHGMLPLRTATQNNDLSWTIVAVPSVAWAQKVFPNSSADSAMNQLWEQIFKATRIYEQDPVAAWHDHNQNLQSKANELNNYQFTALKYTAPGTELTIGLPKNHLWQSAGATNSVGDFFMPNMPTEEVFTAPDANRISGYVSSTKPLSYAGHIIEGIKVHFDAGKITEITAEHGQEVLSHLIQSDDGAKSLGEVSLVPNSSPISQSDVIFFNTLFDENASNHLAIGSAYPFTIEGGTTMSKPELALRGLNVSNIHVDFMIGSDKIDIDGVTATGQLVPVFRQGEWAL